VIFIIKVCNFNDVRSRIGTTNKSLIMKTLEIQSLTKWYGSVCGVEDVSFDIEQGEIFGYLGPNGSGKTTTIRCIMGLLKATSGGVRIFGRQVRPGQATFHNRIGYLPGDFRVWRSLRANRSLDVLASIGDKDHSRKHREELAQRLGLDLNRPVGDLSKGNRQKVGVIYAFQHKPDLLILDEPTSGLDPLVSQTVLDLIREATDNGATILLSSHDLSEVSAVCNRAAILRGGKLVELAPISKIVHQGKRQLKIWFVEGTEVPVLPVEKLAGVREISRKGQLLHITYQGRADSVLKWLSQFPVSRIATPQTSLEEAFMQYYRNDAQQETAAS
jgi:ABC-2 type transport system ATP-binding protein